MRRTVSSLHPALYHMVVALRRTHRRLKWLLSGQRYAHLRDETNLPVRVKKHQSVLLRKLGVTDMQLQINKVTNIRLAIAHLDGILIRPGETFSFCKLVGKTTARRGYLGGVVLSNGEAKAAVGGGLCQVANLIHWLALHSPLTVTERHHHSFDPFPDEGRVLPFGCGATVFYNYLDYQLRNDTAYTFQLRFWLDEKCLHGDLRISDELPYKYHVYEKNHRFLRQNGQIYRENEIWRRKLLKGGHGEQASDEMILKNHSLVKYEIDPSLVQVDT